MKENKPINPPKWANAFLEWYCRPELLEDLQGDLYELFQRNIKTKGIKQARLIYSIDVLKSRSAYFFVSFYNSYITALSVFWNSYKNSIFIHLCNNAGNTADTTVSEIRLLRLSTPSGSITQP